jgi:hypothetical protein
MMQIHVRVSLSEKIPYIFQSKRVLLEPVQMSAFSVSTARLRSLGFDDVHSPARSLPSKI